MSERRTSGMPDESALQVSDLHVHYGASHVLHGASLQVEPQTVTAVVGRNGVGKSTMINTIMGLVPATSGEVLVEGVDLLQLPAHRRRKYGLALVPQGRRLFSGLTVEEHLKLVDPIREGPFGLETILDLFPSLGERFQAYAETLSGGERSMLSIARALIVNPRILLMDEPTEGLAPLLVEAIAESIPRLQEAGLTILLVEQKLNFALGVADYIGVMDRGTIIETFRRAEIEDLGELSDLILQGAGVGNANGVR